MSATLHDLDRLDDLTALGSAGPTGASREATIPLPHRRWTTRVVLPIGALAIAGGLLAYASRAALLPAVQVRAVPVVAQPRDPGAPNASGTDTDAPPVRTVIAQAAGWIEPDPFPVSVSALTPGVVSEVPVLEGATVRKDDVLVRLVDRDARIALDRADAALAQRAAESDRAKALLEAATQTWDHPFERTRAVAVGEAMLAEAEADVVAAIAAAKSERAKQAELEDDLRRKEPLAESGAVPTGEISLLRLRVDAQVAAADRAEALVPLAQAGVARQRAELDAAREGLELRIEEARALHEAEAGLATAQAALRSAQADRDDAVLRLDRMAVKAPIDGVVLARLVQPGTAVSPMMDTPMAGQVVRLYDPRHLQVRVDVPLGDAGKVGVGTAAEVSTEVLPGRTFHGVVSRVVHEADIQRNTVQFKVAIDDPDPQLKPEMLARVRFVTIGDPAADPTDGAEGPAAAGAALRLFIPERALHDRADGSGSLFVVDLGQGAARERIVRLGSARLGGEDDVGDWIEAIDGVRPGDRVVIEAASPLRDGTLVRIQTAPEGEGD